ncbi:helix-turn-helix domain-containing protein [Nakamurella aerolata]|uniref:Helix-turn-helix domain-containing protein n=1 Tax=Nakamurella aerolata TaxID=1656892 RepID=A0A849A875_9ACTN|nr:helix-turn-helix domain-containing protein [Nakamurella aerolata]
MSDNLLGEFLRARRERLDPASVGLRAVGTRRTPGLRREEVAAQAGISVEYLVRLERGRDRNPSPAVVDALTAVLQLDSDASAHLLHLVQRAGGSGDAAGPATELSPTLRRLLDSWPQPSIVTNVFLDLLGANESGIALHQGLGLHPGCNMARELFLNPRSRAVFVDFDKVAAETVGNLRSLSGVHPRHPRLQALVGELSVADEQFARLWGAAEVQAKTTGSKRVAHPTLGLLELEWNTLHVAAAPGQLVVAYQAVAGTRTETVLAQLLRELAGRGHVHRLAATD